ncbi:MAG: phenylacetate--CoA ligase family protein, partial [Rhodospirillaceae bacterium]|nr:phenylacetate--CoA ligase family protein [Rhodospirillaceae bacterium]
MTLAFPKSQAEIAATRRERMRAAAEAALRAPIHRKRLPADLDLDRIHEPDEWRRIPILDKEELRALSPRAFMTDFNIAPRADIEEYWRSGGSTGKPLFYPRTFRDMEFMFEGFRRGIHLAGVRAGDTAHISYPLGIHPVGHVSARVCQQMGVGVNWAGAGANTPSAVQVELIDQMRPTVWMGMPGYALHLANLAEAAGFDLKNSSVNKILCCAEPLSAAKRAKIESMWGATVYDGFGMTEMCMMGAEDDLHDGFRMWTDMFHLEVLDPESHEPAGPGEEGVFPRRKHAHLTAGFFKVRGINITHGDFEDFMFAMAGVQDFKCEALAGPDALDVLRVSYEARKEADAGALAAQLSEKIRNTFELRPE